jgi:hypothetical protein
MVKVVEEGSGQSIVEMVKDKGYKEVLVKAIEEIIAYYAFQTYLNAKKVASDRNEAMMKVYEQLVSSLSRQLPV